MDIQSSKIELAKLILSIDNPEMIKKIKHFLKKETSQEKVKLTKYEKKEIEIALKQLDEGKGISFDDFVKKVS
ncbi:MAG: hypothetical protein WDZ35_00860 [Crocinitomicaceae bacterium]